VAATLAAVILFSTLVVAAVTVQSGADTSAEMSQLTYLENRESITGPILMASASLSLLDEFQQYMEAHPPTNCSSSAKVDSYLSSIVISNGSSFEDTHGITWRVDGTLRYYAGPDPGGDDNLTGLLTPAYAGYSKGEVSLVASLQVQGKGVSSSYSRNETHYLHLEEDISAVCSAFALLLAGRMGMVAPLYADPAPDSPFSAQWAGLIMAKLANPSVPVVAIVDPDNGPGTAEDENFAVGIDALHQAGIAVLGYVDTSYGRVPLSEIENETSSYRSWYHVDGIFFDDMNGSSAADAYYANATLEVHSMGLNYTMANAGASVTTPSRYLADSIVEYEHSGLPDVLTTTNATAGAMIAYSVAQLPPASWFAALHGHGIDWVWVTDQSNSYVTLPTYLGQEMQEVASVG
jgi:Spherulation-specific family 4